MPTKKESTFFDTVKEVVSSSIVKNLKDHTKDFVQRGQEIIYQTTENVMERLFSTMLFSVGSILVIVAVALLIYENLGLSLGWSFLIMGLILLVISLLFKERIRRKKYYQFKR